MPERDSRFQKAVAECLDLTLRDGLQAVSSANKERIRPKDTRSVTGSVNIDEDLKEKFPTENRWDYAVGYRVSDADEKVFFIEVHSAETSQISCVVQKAEHLKKWAESNAPALWNMTIPREIHWIASGRYDLRLNDSYRRRLALAGVSSPKKFLELG